MEYAECSLAVCPIAGVVGLLFASCLADDWHLRLCWATVVEQWLVLDYLMLSIALHAGTRHLPDSKLYDLDNLSVEIKTIIRLDLIRAVRQVVIKNKTILLFTNAWLQFATLFNGASFGQKIKGN